MTLNTLISYKLKSRFLPLEIKTGVATPVFSKVRALFGEKKAEIEQEILSREKKHHQESS